MRLDNDPPQQNTLKNEISENTLTSSIFSGVLVPNGAMKYTYMATWMSQEVSKWLVNGL